MGVDKLTAREGKPKRSKRGSVNNKSRLDAFKAKKDDRGADWATCDPKLLLSVISAITSMGGAVTIGLARDQGAYMLTLLLDGSRETMWFNGDAEIDTELMTVLVTLEDMES